MQNYIIDVNTIDWSRTFFQQSLFLSPQKQNGEDRQKDPRHPDRLDFFTVDDRGQHDRDDKMHARDGCDERKRATFQRH